MSPIKIFERESSKPATLSSSSTFKVAENRSSKKRIKSRKKNGGIGRVWVGQGGEIKQSVIKDGCDCNMVRWVGDGVKWRT
jgi:hypothetical protein